MQNKKRDDTATLTAQAHTPCTPTYVRQLINGKRNANTDKAKAIIETYNLIQQTKDNLSKAFSLHANSAN